MTTCDRECFACPHWDVCNMQAAVEYRAELQAEADDRSDPRICRECECHPDVANRLTELEQDMAQVKGLLWGLAAFFERAGGGD